MRDTIMVALAILAPQKAIPVRQVALTLPKAQTVSVAVLEAKAPRKFTTCHENARGSCWSE